MSKFVGFALALVLGLAAVGSAHAQTYTTPGTVPGYTTAVGYQGQDIIVQAANQTVWCTAVATILLNAQGPQWLPASACPFSVQSVAQVAGCGTSVWVGGQAVNTCQTAVTLPQFIQQPVQQTVGVPVVVGSGNFCGSNFFNQFAFNGCGGNGCFTFGCGQVSTCGWWCRGNFGGCNVPGSCGQGRPPRPDRDVPEEPETPTHCTATTHTGCG